MPYRVDIARASDAVLDRLVELGALDVDRSPGGGIAALMPDGVAPEQVARALGVDDLSISPAVGRDAESVWILTPRAIRIGCLRIVPADASAEPGALRVTDSAAFGTALHPTRAMCLEMIEEALQHSIPDALLDVGTGSGVLALAALLMGVPPSDRPFQGVYAPGQGGTPAGEIIAPRSSYTTRTPRRSNGVMISEALAYRMSTSRSSIRTATSAFPVT